MSITPLEKKSKFLNKSDQERLLQKFYCDLNDEESDYVNVFENEGNVHFCGENISGSDSDADDEIDMELDDNTTMTEAAIDDPTPARKRIFFDLEKVLNLDNYNPLFIQEYSNFEYSNSSKSFQVEWETVRENNQCNSGSVILPKRNLLQNKPGPRNVPCFVVDSIESFSLLIPNSLIDSIVEFTNNRISTFHKQYPELAQVAANRFIKLDELKAYFGILYLCAALK